MRWLVGLTCVVVIAVAGWTVRAARADRLADEAESRRAAIIQLGRESEAKLRECAERVADWTSGNRRALLAEFGEYADDVVADCQKLSPIWEQAVAEGVKAELGFGP